MSLLPEESRLIDGLQEITKKATITNPLLFVLVNYWQYIVMLIMTITIVFLFLRNGNLKTQIDLEVAKSENVTVELATCRAQNDKFRDTMQEVLDNSIEFRDALAKIDTSINKIYITTEQVIDELLSQPPPKTCEESIDYIRQADKTILSRTK